METQARSKAARIVTISRNDHLGYDENIRQQRVWGEKFSDEELSASNLQNYSTATLKVLFQGLGNVTFYTRGAPPHLDRQERVFEELAARGATTADDAMDLFQGYLAARLLDRARRLKDRFPDAKLWKLPVVVEDKDLREEVFRVYDISNDSTTATVKHLPIRGGPWIVVSTWYSCPVAARTLEYIEADKAMRQIMQKHGIILTGRFEPGGVVRRNAKVKFARTYVAYTEQDWPGIEFGASPTFHFLKDGKILHRFWGADTKEGFFQDFKRGLEAIGGTEL